MARTRTYGPTAVPLAVPYGAAVRERLVFKLAGSVLDISAYLFAGQIYDEHGEDATKLADLTLAFESDGSDGVLLLTLAVADRDDDALAAVGTWSSDQQVEAPCGVWRLVGTLAGASPLVLQGPVFLRRFGAHE